MLDLITFKDLFVVTFILAAFYVVAMSIKLRHIDEEPYYKYFLPGLWVKVGGGAAVCLVYIFYYRGGDTFGYFHDNVCISRLFVQNPIGALKFTFMKIAPDEMWTIFNNDTDWPYSVFDSHGIYVVKLTWILSLVTFNSFLGQTMLLSFLSFFPIWRMYKMFLVEFPTLQKGLAFSMLFIPSVVFWGSGLLKDTLTFAAVSLFTSSFYYIIKFKRKYFLNILFLLFSSWVLIKIKPYILFAILPGTIIWFTSYKLETVRNRLVRSAITPTIIGVAVFAGFLSLKMMGSAFSEYSVDQILEKAVVTQQDLLQDYYRGSSFNIGDFEPTVKGVLAKAPIAIVSALFRPFLWESYNPAMIVSGTENLAILIFTIYLLVRLRIYNFFRLLLKNHLLFFCTSFSLFFAFSVGLSTSNFGALVRYKIPAIPFFVASLIITNYFYEQKKKEELAETNKPEGFIK